MYNTIEIVQQFVRLLKFVENVTRLPYQPKRRTNQTF